ncbi:unnamed protein product [Brassica oleracea]
MVKLRLCPRQDQSSPLQSCRQLGFGQVFSDQLAAYRQRTLIPSDLVPGGFKETPYSLDREDSDRRGHGLWLSDYTTVDPKDCGLSRGDPKDCGPRSEDRILPIVKEEHNVTRARVCYIYYIVFRVVKPWFNLRLSLVALGKDDRVAWCWTLGPPV